MDPVSSSAAQETIGVSVCPCTKKFCLASAYGVREISSRHQERQIPLNRPKSAQAITPVNEKPDPLPVVPFHISRERLMEGISTASEVLNEILQRHRELESMRHW